ncbi:MAG: selenocysteine-specific translation elongation factor [Oscillospiraceae bacterium]|nr:selenocysteine-specific translation elongation factor [Oscillospiraceae bacterium]
MKHIVLGTAGHVDHGKTTLVRHITGHNTDRLKEEQTRGITIELGFAPFTLPNGQHIGIVDVPGHERFVKNMLAGATGVDLFMLVIAADEGIMQQTREHIDILRLLGISRGVVVLTKIDTVDKEWLELVREDVSEYLSDGPFAKTPIVEVSSMTGEGIPKLLETIEMLSKEINERPSTGVLRLAVDRVFTMTGFGTIVTGTIWGGMISQGDTVELMPTRKQARVRSLQVHGEKREQAYAGERVAVNLTGIEKEFVERGNWLTKPDVMKENRRIDIRIELLDTAPEISQRIRVHVHHGTAELLARVKLLDQSTLAPGESCFAQLELEEPLSAMPGDRVILRFYSPMFTIGGGTVLDAAAVRHKRRYINENLGRLEALHSGNPKQILLASMMKDGTPWQLEDIASSLQSDMAEAKEVAIALKDSEQLLTLNDGYYFPVDAMNMLIKKLETFLSDYCLKWPMRFGAPKKEVSQIILSKMDTKKQRAIFQYIDHLENFAQDEKLIWQSGWKPVLTALQEKTINDISEVYERTPLTPPTWTEVITELDIPAKEQGEYLQWFHRSERLVRVADDVQYTPQALKEAESILRTNAPNGYTLGEARDLLGTSRKYAQKIGEYFDLIKLTYWDGEKHYWKS